MQDFYAPISSLTSKSKISGLSLEISCHIIPRGIQEIPAFILKDYQLVWEIRSKHNTCLAMGAIDLKEVHPSSELIKYEISIPNDKDMAMVKWSLLNPTGYVVKTNTNFLDTPNPPQVKDLLISGRDVRILLESENTREQSQLYYQIDTSVYNQPFTSSHFLDLTGLPIGKTISCWIVGKNSFGTSNPSKKITFQTKAGITSLPPIIWQLEPSNNGCFIGYSFQPFDNLYEVRYGNNKYKVDEWKTISTTNFGMLEIPNLVNGNRYYIQMKKYTGYNNTSSIWSEVMSVIPNSQHHFGNIQIHGFVQQNKDLFISLTPSSNEKGFQVIYKTNTEKITKTVNQSAVDLIRIELLSNKKIISVDVVAL